MAVGRISGPLLTENLERNGIDLAFKNTLSDTSVLKLDVTSNKVGVNRNSAAVELDSTGSQTRTTDLISTTARIANFDISNSAIDIISGSITLQGATGVSVSNLETDNIRVTDNIISTHQTNANLELAPTSNLVTINNALNVQGNVDVTNNVSFDGNLTIGDEPSDTVTFNSEVVEDLYPSANNTYDLGSSSYKWSDLYTNLVNGVSINADEFTIADDRPAQRTGNSLYVAVNGNDSNAGDHPNGPFATIKKALDFADSSISGPVTIYIYPGDYQEELPLEVPSQVTVSGTDMRNVIIEPTTSAQSEDVFLMNGESTVQNVTLKNFYYDSVNDKGYGFRFAPNTTVSTRSPYIQNVSVITQGSTTSASDPRGFASGDAGKGALVDGADVTSASKDAAMLFHSVTFITPGVDGLTMTNGVKVEWLNSFSYFANRGLYAVNGATGHLSTDGSTVTYGAEIRSIGSANVYGNYGAVADGDDCLMYLIMHNFAYIGVGKHSDNDPSRVIQSQEVTEANSGKVYYQSTDHLGNFRVGDEFFVDLETGESTITVTEGELDSIGGLRVTTNSETTEFLSTQVTTGNFKFKNNSITTSPGAINLASASTIEFLTNVNMTQTLDITGDLSVGGSVTSIGDSPTDTLDFNVQFSQNLEPNVSGISNLGTPSKKWLQANLSKANVSDVRFMDNYITTNLSNSDLELRANGTGIVYIEDANLVVETNTTTFNGLTTILDTDITGTITQSGNYNITGNTSHTNFSTTDLLVDKNVSIDDFEFIQNRINVTASDQDFVLKANSTGKILFPNNNVYIGGNISIGTVDVNKLIITNNVALEDFKVSSDIKLFDNVITTTLSNSNLDLRANGTGTIEIDDFDITQDTISSDTNITFAVNQNIIISATGSLKLPTGTQAQDPQTQYSIRYNSEDNLIEGYNSSRLSFNSGIYSDDRLTSGTASNNQINFTANTTNVTRLLNQEINSNSISADSITIGLTNNEISSTGNINLVSGTNTINIEDLVILSQTTDDSTNAFTITNPTTDQPIKLKGTGSGNLEGYWSFRNLPALKFPSGTTATRPTSPLVGQARHNQDTDELEVYNGTEWQTAAGEFDNISEADMEEEAFTQTLIYG